MLRYITCLLLLSLLASVLAQAPSSPTITVTIHPEDKPMEMEQVQALLATDAADRLVPRPPTLTDDAYRKIVLSGEYEQLDGFWPFKPPTGDPAAVTKADYLAAVTAYPGIENFETRHGKTPVTADLIAYDAIPVFVAMYKATGEHKYLELTARCVEAVSLYMEEEVVKKPTATYSDYWTYLYAFVYLPLLEIQDTPEFKPMLARFAKACAARANAWPTQGVVSTAGAHLHGAIWYELALRYGPDFARKAEVQDYQDRLWNDYWQGRDINEDDPNYTAADLLVLHGWCQLRGVKWWEDKEAVLLWKDFAEQIGNDGAWPAFGDGGNLGRYAFACCIGEMTARYTRDGRYKWLARRAFWNAKDRLKQLCANIGYEHITYLAMAYLMADDTIPAVPPKAGVTVTQRHWRELTPWEIRKAGVVFATKPERITSKVVFRGGMKETDDYLILQAEQYGGHGHPDSAAISSYSGQHAYYLTYASQRLDHFMEAHNLFAMREPPYDKAWPGRYTGMMTTEDVTVPVSGQARGASYARVHVQEYPGNPATPERWKEVHDYKTPLPPIKAIGYKHWPLRLDRSVLFVNNAFTVVRDVTRWTLPVTAQIGQNWTFGEMGDVGTNWVNVWTPKLLSGYFSYESLIGNRKVRLAPLESAPRDLLIWYAPQPDGALVLEKLVHGRTGQPSYDALNINLRLRSWYTRTGEWQPEKPQAFTSILYPHPPGQDAAKLAAQISVLRDEPGVTVLQVNNGDTRYIIVLNSGGAPVTAGQLTTDAESVLLTLVKGKPASLAAWRATRVRYGAKTLHKTAKPGDLDYAWK